MSLLQKLLLLVGFALVINKGFCEDYNYNDDEAGADDEDDTAGLPVKILNQGGPLKSRPGGTLHLRCEVQNRDSAVIQWRKGETPLYFDYTKQTTDPRIKMDAENTIIIEDVKQSDAGEYTCQILGAEEKIFYDVQITSAPSILRVVPEGPLKVIKKGTPLTLMCEVAGDPKPKIQWTHRKVSSLKEEPLIGDIITFDQVSRSTSGMFTCTAVNTNGKDNKTINIDVQYEPEVEVPKEVINTAEGYESEIVCIVYAHPPAKVVWYKDDRIVRESHFKSFINENSVHTLRISTTKNSDFGTYKCVAQNDIGSASKTCLLSGLPSRPIFLSTKVADDNKSPLLIWQVHSYSPIKVFELLYKRQEEDKWNSVQPVVEKDDSEFTYLAKHALKNLEPGTYVAQIKAKNDYGWSSLSEIKSFFGGVIEESGAMQSKLLESSQTGNGSCNLEKRISIVFVLSLIVAHLLS